MLVNVNDVLEFIEEPAVYLGQFMNLVNVVLRQVHGLRDDKDTLVRRLAQCSINICNFQLLVLYKTVHPLANHAQSLLDGFLEVASDSHYLAHRLHAGAQFLVNTVELGQVPAGNLANHIVKSRFEEGRRRLGHRVLQLKQAVAHAQFGSHKSQRIACSLRGQGGRTAQTGIDLNDTIVFRLRVKGILHVTLAHNADMANDLDGQRTEFVIF